jgi:hypothetical protein
MLARVLILGANGQLARNTTRVLPGNPALTLTLYLRRAKPAEEPEDARSLRPQQHWNQRQLNITFKKQKGTS